MDTHYTQCTQCHDGTPNAVLIRPSVFRPDGSEAAVTLGALEGAMVHGGEGLCETCHTTTRHYTRTADAAPHETARCADCHLHVEGFTAPPAPPSGR